MRRFMSGVKHVNEFEEMNKVLLKHGIDPDSVMCGACVGIGWHHIIDRMITELVELEWNKDLHQIKEKFGGLRVYIGDENEAMAEVICRAERYASVTCEACGDPGESRNTRWIKTLCDECNKTP